jgi:hypothetical protein
VAMVGQVKVGESTFVMPCLVEYVEGQRHMDAEEWQQALECFEDVVWLEPGDRDAARRLSQVLQELGQLQAITASLAASKVDLIQYVRALTGHRKDVNAVAFSPDGRIFDIQKEQGEEESPATRPSSITLAAASPSPSITWE